MVVMTIGVENMLVIVMLSFCACHCFDSSVVQFILDRAIKVYFVVHRQLLSYGSKSGSLCGLLRSGVPNHRDRCRYRDFREQKKLD